jgi:hypothetical protein
MFLTFSRDNSQLSVLCRNSKAPNISPRGERFRDETKRKIFIPGPGSYEIRDYSDGNYVLSQYKSS